jgi:hypothetical protein
MVLRILMIILTEKNVETKKKNINWNLELDKKNLEFFF